MAPSWDFWCRISSRRRRINVPTKKNVEPGQEWIRRLEESIHVVPRCSCGRAYRFGVWLTPKKLEIFDKIMRAKKLGVPSAAFAINRENLKAHIHQINDMFAATDLEIRGISGSH